MAPRWLRMIRVFVGAVEDSLSKPFELLRVHVNSLPKPLSDGYRISMEIGVSDRAATRGSSDGRWCVGEPPPGRWVHIEQKELAAAVAEPMVSYSSRGHSVPTGS